MMFPRWYYEVCAWSAAVIGCGVLLCGALVVADRALTKLWKYLGVYNIVFHALWKEAGKREDDK